MRIFYFLLLGTLTVLSADWLFNPKNICVKSFYFKDGSYYVTWSKDDTVHSGTTKNLADDFFPDYEYNATTEICSKISPNNTLGIDNHEFNLLSAFTGLTVAGLLVWGLL